VEIKINKEIRNYNEYIFFGLSLRQFIFTILSCISAVLVYLIGKTILPTRIVSWLCILVSFPFIAIGFLTYNGMKAEEFLVVLIKYYFIVPRKLLFKPTNFYEELMKGVNISNENI
jgi:hypothetical protein